MHLRTIRFTTPCVGLRRLLIQALASTTALNMSSREATRTYASERISEILELSKSDTSIHTREGEEAREGREGANDLKAIGFGRVRGNKREQLGALIGFDRSRGGRERAA